MTQSLPNYGQRVLTTKAWDSLQAYLRCCAIDNLGWSSYNQSNWFRETNRIIYEGGKILPISSRFYKSIPESCCRTLIDGVTGYPTNHYLDVNRCQSWQYGPPLLTSGPHNDALYYRGCFNVLVEYMKMHTKYIFMLSSITTILMIGNFILLVYAKLFERSYERKFK